MKFISLVIK